MLSRGRDVAGIFLLILTACASPSGTPAARIAEPGIAAAYLPLQGRIRLGLEKAAGAAMVIAPGVAATNAHNADLVDPGSVIGVARQSDLMFFRVVDGRAPAATAPPLVGEAVTAYGQGTDGSLRQAHGVVQQIVTVPGYAESPYFIFAAPGGPGFSGGPVVDASGRLIGITFGYQDRGRMRLVYAYNLARVRAEFSGLAAHPAKPPKLVRRIRGFLAWREVVLLAFPPAKMLGIMPVSRCPPGRSEDVF